MSIQTLSISHRKVLKYYNLTNVQKNKEHKHMNEFFLHLSITINIEYLFF